MKILVTGAAGRVGTQVCCALAAEHELRLLDVVPIESPPGEAVRGSVADWGTVQRAVAGVDAVAHLAIHSPARTGEQSYEQYIQDDVNVGVKGTDMLLHASTEAGCRRFVYTSSMNVYSARYPQAGEFLRDSDETLSREHYGTIKWLAEELCRHYALSHRLSTIVLRFNSVTFPDHWEQNGGDKEHPEHACTRVHIDDVARAVRLALEMEGVPWGRCLISGSNPEERLDTHTAEKLIGFRARYGFEADTMYKDGQVEVKI